MEAVKIIFMVSTPVLTDEHNNDVEDVQKNLENENDLHGDILQSSIEDGHRKLGYKILTGMSNGIHSRGGTDSSLSS